MPPKTKYNLDDIINTAFKIVRRDGIDKLTARVIARELKSSTMPIYSCGKTMAEIEEEVVKKAWILLEEYQSKPRSYDVYLDMGLGYVMFAKEERNLFKCIHSDKHESINKACVEENLLINFQRLSGYPMFEGISDEFKLKVMVNGATFSHGFAVLMANPLGRLIENLKTEEQITAYFIEANMITWNGIKNLLEQNLKKDE